MPTPQPVVSLRHWTEFEGLDAVLAACLDDLGGLEQFVAPGGLVVIKPNITANGPAESGGTTHVELVEAIVRRVQRCAPGRVVVAEGTGEFGSQHETAFTKGGWREMAARTGVELYNLDAGPHREVPLEHGRCSQALPVSELILAADTYITVPCLKTHLGADYTVALKNGFGVLPQAARSELHAQGRVEHSLVDLNRVRPPDLAVVDGWDGAEGIAGGTKFDRPAGARLMLLGSDPVAVDVVSREIMCFTAPTRYLAWAIEDGLGEGRLEHIEVRGASLEACRHPFMTPSDEVAMGLPGLELHDLRACSGCRNATLISLGRLYAQKLLRPVHIVYGREGELPPLESAILAVGDCAARRTGCVADDGCTTYVAGCPPQQGAIADALDALGCTCRRCRDVAAALLETLPAALLPYLRITAAGTQVHRGERVERDKWHLELLVGDCMLRYADAVMGRARQFGLDPERDIALVEGCPPDEAALRAAVARLQSALEAMGV